MSEILEFKQNTNVSGNIKELYIIFFENQKEKLYLAQNLTKLASHVEFSGWEITNNKSVLDKIKKVEISTILDVLKEKEELELLTIPWIRIVKIKTLKYKQVK